MIDGAKILKGIKCCVGNPLCTACPYNNGGCASLYSDVCELLTECEPVKPEILIDTWVCGNCKAKLERQTLIGPDVLLHEQFSFCPDCGRKVDWNVE